MKKYILLDLDGTLTNPKLGITKSVQYALRAFGINEPDLESLCKYIGPPIREALKEYHGFDPDRAEEAVVKYREYFAETGIFENEVYEGIPDVLSKLQSEGKILIVATSKPEEFARRILEHFNLDGYFTDICGATMDGTRTTKEEVIRYALDRNHISKLSSVVMVGDRLHDTVGAKMVGIESIGVLYGFGDREELEKAGADRIAATVKELYQVVSDMD